MGRMTAMGQNAKNGGLHAMSAWQLITEVQLVPDTARSFGCTLPTIPIFVVPPWYQYAGYVTIM